jgi:hypothetical protein
VQVRFSERFILISRNRDIYIWLSIFVLSIIFYGCTAQKCFSWQDSGMFQWRILTGDTVGNLGLALAHPLYIIAAGWFSSFPFGEIAVRLNLFSGVGMAVALSNLVFLVRILTSKLWPGIAVAGMFAVMHTPWWLSTIAEVYTWNLAFFTLELFLFVKCIRNPKGSTAMGLALVSGLNWSIHNLALIAVPVYFGAIIYLVCTRRLKATIILGVITAFIAGAGIYLYYILIFTVEKQSFFGAAQSALFGRYTEQVLNIDSTWRFNLINAGLIALNFLNIIVPLALAGFFYITKKNCPLIVWSLGLIAVLEFTFALRFPVPDQFTFILPSLLLMVLAAGIGMCALFERFNRFRWLLMTGVVFSIIGPPVCYSVGPAIISGAGNVFQREHERPFRDELRYWAMPWKHNECSAESFATAALLEAEPNGVILSDETAYYPLLLVQERDHQTSKVDILRFSDFLEQNCSESEYKNKFIFNYIYVVLPLLSSFPEGVRKNIDFDRDEGSVLYRVVWRGEG